MVCSQPLGTFLLVSEDSLPQEVLDAGRPGFIHLGCLRVRMLGTSWGSASCWCCGWEPNTGCSSLQGGAPEAADTPWSLLGCCEGSWFLMPRCSPVPAQPQLCFVAWEWVWLDTAWSPWCCSCLPGIQGHRCPRAPESRWSTQSCSFPAQLSTPPVPCSGPGSCLPPAADPVEAGPEARSSCALAEAPGRLWANGGAAGGPGQVRTAAGAGKG